MSVSPAFFALIGGCRNPLRRSSLQCFIQPSEHPLRLKWEAVPPPCHARPSAGSMSPVEGCMEASTFIAASFRALDAICNGRGTCVGSISRVVCLCTLGYSTSNTRAALPHAGAVHVAQQASARPAAISSHALGRPSSSPPCSGCPTTLCSLRTVISRSRAVPYLRTAHQVLPEAIAVHRPRR